MLDGLQAASWAAVVTAQPHYERSCYVVANYREPAPAPPAPAPAPAPAPLEVPALSSVFESPASAVPSVAASASRRAFMAGNTRSLAGSRLSLTYSYTISDTFSSVGCHAHVATVTCSAGASRGTTACHDTYLRVLVGEAKSGCDLVAVHVQVVVVQHFAVHHR